MYLRAIALSPTDTSFQRFLKKVVLQQLSDKLKATDTLELFQSVYKADHSTKTLLLRVIKGLLMACDQGSVSIL